jgi:hypothetical protein
MLLLIGLVVALTVAVVISRSQRAGRMNGRDLGWMSEQWLAEQRASHSR